MELSEIRGRDDRQLRLDLQELRKEHFTLRFRGFSEGVANTSRFRHIKRSVARILTVLGERERAAANAGRAADSGTLGMSVPRSQDESKQQGGKTASGAKPKAKAAPKAKKGSKKTAGEQS